MSKGSQPGGLASGIPRPLVQHVNVPATRPSGPAPPPPVTNSSSASAAAGAAQQAAAAAAAAANGEGPKAKKSKWDQVHSSFDCKCSLNRSFECLAAVAYQTMKSIDVV